MRGGGRPTATQKHLPTSLLGHWLSHEATHPTLPSYVGTMYACHGSAQNGSVNVSGLGPTLRTSAFTKLHNPQLAPVCACVSFVPILFLVLTLGGGKPHTAVSDTARDCFHEHLQKCQALTESSRVQAYNLHAPSCLLQPAGCLRLMQCSDTPVYIVY